MATRFEWTKLWLDNWKIIAPILALVLGGGGLGYNTFWNTGKAKELSVTINEHAHPDASIQRMKDHMKDYH